MRNNFMQLGRSMVEMLGVLAIIGVLSIVGIQGYKKAMLKIKVNAGFESANKFLIAVQEYLFLHPEDADKTVYIRAPIATDNLNVNVFLNRLDLLPDFANNNPTNFWLVAKLHRTNENDRFLKIQDIRHDGFCRMMFPNGEESKSSNTVTKVNGLCSYVNGLKWCCYVQTGNNIPNYEL